MKDRKPNGRSRFWLGRLPRQRFQETDGLPKIVASGGGEIERLSNTTLAVSSTGCRG
jgi:hypothetical protein